MRKLLLSAACLCSASIANAGPTITFEGYANPSYYYSFTDHGATFTAAGATDEFAIGTFTMPPGGWGTSGPMILCPHTIASYCGGDFNVSFVSPVDHLQFYFTGDDSTSALSVQAFLHGISLGSISVNGDGKPGTAQLVNLASFGAIDSIKVTGGGSDPWGGLGYDDFSFLFLPEPSTWALMLLGFGAIGLSMRRERRRSIAAQS
jgi:hypothetical protein